MKTSIYDEVTNQIIEEIEAGAGEWSPSWIKGGFEHQNRVSHKAYRGINILILMMAQARNGFSSNEWLTYKQAGQLGGNVRKGEKGTRITFFKTIEKDGEKGDKETKIIPILRTYTVFNLDQCEGIEAHCKPQAINPDSRSEAIDSFMAATKADIRHGGDSAFYMPSTDHVQLPEFEHFAGANHYYATAFHELTHWTGGKARTGRIAEQAKGFKTMKEGYAFEELVAELGAAMLCAQHGVTGELRHAAYIENWLQALKGDNKFIFKAAKLAQQAADLLNEAQSQNELAA